MLGSPNFGFAVHVGEHLPNLVVVQALVRHGASGASVIVRVECGERHGVLQGPELQEFQTVRLSGRSGWMR